MTLNSQLQFRTPRKQLARFLLRNVSLGKVVYRCGKNLKAPTHNAYDSFLLSL
jgi:hypothetical protein